MSKTKEEEIQYHEFCDGDCNNCEAIYNRQLTVILNALYERFGEGVYDIVQHYCPNMTVCADCRIDDFCHCSGCELMEEAEKWRPKKKKRLQ